MNINELNGKALKKSLGCARCMFRWHNKNKSGGNFGINVEGLNWIDYEISGYYDTDGKITHLSFGRIYRAGSPIVLDSYPELIEAIKTRLEVIK